MGINYYLLDGEVNNSLADGPTSLVLARDINHRLYSLMRKFPDPDGAPWADYLYLCYSDDDGVTWTEEEITNSRKLFEGESDEYISIEGGLLVINSSGDVHIIFYRFDADEWNGGIYYMNKVGSSWSDPVLISYETEEYHNASLAIDSQDDLHVIWQEWGAKDLHYRKCTSGVWGSITTFTGTFDYPIITIDSNDDIHLLFGGTGYGTYPANYNILYRKCTSGVWGDIENVTNYDYDLDTYSASMAIDSSGVVHVSWGDGNDVCYKKRTTEWSSITYVLTILLSTPAVYSTAISINLANVVTCSYAFRYKDLSSNTVYIAQYKTDADNFGDSTNIWSWSYGTEQCNIYSPLASLFPRDDSSVSYNIAIAGFEVAGWVKVSTGGGNYQWKIFHYTSPDFIHANPSASPGPGTHPIIFSTRTDAKPVIFSTRNDAKPVIFYGSV